MKNRAGDYRINFPGEAEYRSFIPAPLPPALQIDDDMLQLLVEANKSVSALESVAQREAA